MSSSGASPLVKHLPWLDVAPADFRAQCRALRTLCGDILCAAVKKLAAYSLGINQMHQLAAATADLPREGTWSSAFSAVKLAIASTGTTEVLKAPIVATGLRYGLDIEIIEGPFGQVVQTALDPNSQINRACPDFVLPLIDHRSMQWQSVLADSAAEDRTVDTAFQWVDSIRAAFRANSGATVIMPTIVPPATRLFGSYDASVHGTVHRIINRLNARICDEFHRGGSLVLDLSGVANTVGLDEWQEEGYWHAAKLMFAQPLLPLFAELAVRLIAASRGKSRKCLVLDLDNTIWGGVIGDDGVEGLVLGNGSAKGEAFLAIQRTALELRKIGIVLAVCSKNDDETARIPFRQHPEMLLKEGHIAVFQANWQDKATNLRAIATALNIGTEALVLLDDNPAERALVRRELPEVAVPELPDDPAHFPRILTWAGYFESIGYSAEDARRADDYAANAARAELAAAITDLPAYLRSLDMTMNAGPFDDTSRRRIVQLINKTNQFNFTTKRYSEAQILEIERASNAVTLQIRLRDKFADNGLIAVVIAFVRDDILEIDTWLMSCRVLNRTVEAATLNCLLDAAMARRCRTIRGLYKATPKNGMIKDQFGKLGFKQIASSDDGSVWELQVSKSAKCVTPIKIEPVDV